ncbi:Ig-like domain-containing protein [Anaerosporobacter faecicola]|uniref:Ig-like domain-containing protein n=1 Tax=Anaerosporobacter faecicola TaxID=2718714 RepID=UPI001439E9FC|nr:Ig-like domain-containing protein [Anaerosporobacter faecicola]
MKQRNKRNVARSILMLVLVLIMVVPTRTKVSAAITLNKKSIVVVKGGKEQVRVKGTSKSVTWTSADRSIATVDQNGVVKGVKKGSTKVYATVSGKRYTCTVKVESVTLSMKSKKMTVGSNFTLKLNGTSQKISFKSSNTKVATVSSTGKVKAVAAGNAIITATIDKKSWKCTVTVVKKSIHDEIEQIHTAVKKAYGSNYNPKVSFGKEEITNIIGLKASLYDEIIAEQPLVSFQVDTFIAVHPVAGKKTEVKKALENYKRYLEEETLQYPMNQAKIKASTVETIGDYVFFIMLGKNTDGDEQETQMIKFYEEQNKIAIQAIKKVLE